MKTKTFQEILQQAGYKVREYSGRTMGRETCLSVAGDNVSQATLLGDLIDSVEHLSRNDWCDHVAVIVEALRETKEDAMGKGTVTYWPRIKFDKKMYVDSINDSFCKG
jgi:hypothetical protein